jgi:integrase
VNGDLAGHVTGYLSLRRALGYLLLQDEKLLRDYVDYAAAHGIATVTVAMTAAWAEHDPRHAAHVVSKRVSTIRLFAQYLQAFDPDCEPIPARLLSATLQRRSPFIFTAEQVADLLAATVTIRSPLWSAGARTLFGLLTATGMRPGEAWRLDDSDLTCDADSGQGLLLIRCSKWGRTRQLPLHPSTLHALLDYQGERDRLRSDDGSCPALLLDASSLRLHATGPASTLRSLLSHAGIAAPPGQRPPRAHDLRHTFAVNTLRDWHAAGLAVAPRLAALSTYLGHVNPAHTYWYFQAVPDLMTVLGERLAAEQTRAASIGAQR